MSPSKEKLAGVKGRKSLERALGPGDVVPVPRGEFLSMSKHWIALLKESLVSIKRVGISGGEFVRTYSRIVDAIIGVVFQRAIQENQLTPGAVDLAVIGMGGYGRAELAPYSDVDILILCRRKTRLVRQVAASFIRLLWDTGFELGHSVQSLVESDSMLSRNMDVRTALIESRWICGSAEIARAVEKQISRIRRSDREAFLKRKIRDAIARHRRYGNSYQLVEPNVKLSPGGMRDYQTLAWLGMVIQGRKTTRLSALRKKRLLLPGEESALRRAYDFLLGVRVELHLATQSKLDQLTVRMQRVVTERLGYGGRGDHLGVELFMKDYYMHTRTIYRITEDIIEELGFGSDVGILLGRKKRGRDGNVYSARVTRKRIKEDPLCIFMDQRESGLKLDRSLKRRLGEVLERDLKGTSTARRMRRRFPDLLRNGENVSLVLRAMHETGFLGWIIPEYKLLTCLKRYDLYHHYTADEHSFRVVEALEYLASVTRGRSSPLARIYSEVADKKLLFLAALLHDIGKIQGRGHAKKGGILARKILKRMALKKDEIDFVCFLIENHLLMSHFSQRRDPTDIGTISAFCLKVKNRTNLKFLCLLTFADLKATSPLVWTKWKQSLLWGFYLKAYQFMAKKEKKPDAVYKARKKNLLRAFQPGKEKERARRHLDLLPGRYLLTMSASQVEQHISLIEALDGRKGLVSMRKRKLSTEITFCTYDKPFRLSHLCGVLTVNDLNILFAFAFTRKDGKVIDVFQVEDITGTLPVDAKRVEIIERDLIAVLQGREDINAKFENHISKWKRKRETAIPVSLKVEFENDLSGDFTIIDIFAQDEPGLLYRIARALSCEGLTIYRARISTEANRAIDAFYVQDKNGRKVKSVYKLKKIRERLERDLLA